MKYWFDTVETIPGGLGFSHYDGMHLAWLAGGAVFLMVLGLCYRAAGEPRRSLMRKAMALTIIADELFKMAMLLIGGRYLPGYLPLHLCSVNIFLIAVHAWRPSVTLDNFLYTVGIPGALAAMLFPPGRSCPWATLCTSIPSRSISCWWAIP